MNSTISFIQFKAMVAEHLGVDNKLLKRDTSFIEDLGIDSLSLVNFILKLEKIFNIRIKIENVWTLKNIGNAYDIFIQKLKNTQGI